MIDEDLEINVAELIGFIFFTLGIYGIFRLVCDIVWCCQHMRFV